MRKLLLMIITSIMVSFSAFAQTTSKVDLFGGYSFFREGNNNLDGWTGSGAYNINSWLGVVGEGSGRYQSQDVTALGRSFELDRVNLQRSMTLRSVTRPYYFGGRRFAG